MNMHELNNTGNDMFDAERKRAEERLRILSMIFEKASWGIAISGKDDNTLELMNPAFAEMHGYTVEELTGTPLLNLFAPQAKAHVMSHIRLAHEKEHHSFESHHNRKDGAIFPVSVEVTAIRDNDGDLLCRVVHVQDLTEQAKLKEQLRHAWKMEAVGRLVGGIAHDFNNILTTILGCGILLKGEIEENTMHESYLNMILLSSEKASELAQGLLAFSGNQVMSLKKVDLNEVVLNVGWFLSRLIGEDIVFSAHTASSPLFTMVDVHQIDQVLMNLAANARDAMPEGGYLTIATDHVVVDKESVTKPGSMKAGVYALITFSDTGKGMDEETRKKIFQPFSTTKEAGKGAVLGLSITYGIITRHGGYLTVNTELGTGTTFKIYLPVAEALTPEEARSQTLETPVGGEETILLAEDHEEARNVIKQVLEKFGYVVIEAVNGEDAVHKFVKHQDVIKLFITDVIMPVKNGKDASEEIRAMKPGLKILFISGYSGEFLHNKVILDAGIKILMKPLSFNTLLLKMRELLDGSFENTWTGARTPPGFIPNT